MRTRLLTLSVVGLLLALPGSPACGIGGFGVAAWGDNTYGQLLPPDGDDFVAVAGGQYHSLVLRSDGSIAAWGWDAEGQASPPAGHDYVAVAAGAVYSLALRSDGSIAAWGSNIYDQASPPAGNDFVAIAAGWEHALALRADGSIVGWGSNAHGEASPPVGNDFVAIAAGAGFSLALKSNGAIVGWGTNGEGQASPPRGRDYLAISAGGWHGLALRADGSIAAWGGNGFDQASPPWGTGYTAVSAGWQHSLALRADGSVVGWGRDTEGEASPPAGNGYLAISAGGFYSLALLNREAPEAFGKLAPSDAGTGMGQEVALSWAEAPWADSYEYCVDTSDDDACAGWVDVGAVTTAGVSALDDGTAYFWQVRAGNDFGTTEADGGTWWSFTTGPPDEFGKVAPAEGATGQSGRPLLSWEGPSGAASYEYCLDTTDDDACDTSWVSAGSAVASPPLLAYETTYFWQVRAVNSFGATYADGGSWWPFTTKPTPPVLEASFRSVGAYDGWVLERAEASGKGGTVDAEAVTARVGDDDADRQWRSILDFDTSALPDDAAVVGVTIRIRRESVTGTHPLLTHGMLKVDIDAGAYHDDPELEMYDFHAIGSRGNVGRFLKAAVGGWYRAPLRVTACPLVNPVGHTQFRLRFKWADDDDQTADWLSFYTGDAPVAADRPELVVAYYIP